MNHATTRLYRSVRSSFAKILILVTSSLIVSAVDAEENTPDVGSGMGGEMILPTEVVILLGTDYDFEKAPFVTAMQVVSSLQWSTRNSGSIEKDVPKLSTVRVDVESPLPNQAESKRSAVLELPPGTSAEAAETLKRQLMLYVIRLGINRVHVINREVSTNEKEAAEQSKPKVWLREPFLSVNELHSKAKELGSLVDQFARFSPESVTQTRRIDLFLQRHPGPNRDPFSRQAANDPFAADPFAADPFAADPFGRSSADQDPFATENTNQRRARNPSSRQLNLQPPPEKRTKELVMQELSLAKAKIRNRNPQPTGADEASRWFESEFETRREIYQLELELLEFKIRDMKERLSTLEATKELYIQDRINHAQSQRVKE